MTTRLVELLYQSWSDLDRALEGLTDSEATTRVHGGSAIAWTVGHVSQMADSWINGRFQRLPASPVLSRSEFRTGASGDWSDWPAIRSAVDEIRANARRFLSSITEQDLDQVVPYDGSITDLRASGLRLGYAIMRIAAHHWIHSGEIVTVRSRMGWQERTGRQWGVTLL